MRRIDMPMRPDWIERCESVGFTFHTINGVYWDESAAYEFTAGQVDHIESVTEELHRLALQAVAWVIEQRWFEPFGLSTIAIDEVLRSWQRRDPTIYGRFDFSWDGRGEPKLLEYNADTPTALLEASVVQWFWLQDVRPGADQFNSLHEKLVERWNELRQQWPPEVLIHFAAIADCEEDQGNTAYLLDTAVQAGLNATAICIEDIGFDEARLCFVDLQGRPMTHCFKLYPWEWMFRDTFASCIGESGIRFLEPPWKILMSSKVILAIMSQMNPGHPNILPASLTPDIAPPYVRKPRYSREGANVQMVSSTGTLDSGGPYAEEGFIYQAAAPLPRFGDRYATVSSWVVGDRAAGLGIREDASPITLDTSQFVPHYFT